jgi:predicted dehydrogenase
MAASQEGAWNMTKLRWGLLSTARINRALIPAIRASARGELMAVASRDGERAQEYAAQWGIPRAYGSYEELLADPDVDVIYNPLPNHLHAPWSIRALEAGKHVLCEKPFALNVADVDAMFAAARRAGRAIADGFMYRHHPRILKARELVQGGAIGEVRVLLASFSFTLDRPTDTRWDAQMGGGALWDVGCYPVSLARYIFGEAPTRVSGWAKTTPAGVDETFAGTLHFGDDAIAQFDCSFAVPFRTRAEIAGTQGTLTLNMPFRPDAPESTLILRCGDASETVATPDLGRYLAEVDDLHAQALDGKAPEIPEQETRDNIETIVRLYQAAGGGPAAA